MIACYVGGIGSGKSYKAFTDALAFADQYDKVIVSNVRIKSQEALLDYCWKKGYKRLFRRLLRGEWVYDEDLKRMISFENALVLADEIGVLMNKRDVASGWKHWGPFFLKLALTRHEGTHLFHMCQDLKQLDQELIALTQHFYHMNSWGDWLRIWTQFRGVGYKEFLACVIT